MPDDTGECRDLYFIPPLMRAFQRSDRGTALREAFEEIASMGKRAGREQGQRQFLRFMEEAVAAWRVTVLLVSEGRPVTSFGARVDAGEVRVPGIEPGEYSLWLSTGRCLWLARLTAEQLLWNAAFPSEPLRLAADSEGGQGEWSHQVRLLDGEVVIRIYPGVGSGTLGIAIRSMETDD